MTAAPELLLLSSSRVHGYGYLEFARDELAAFFDGYPKLHFVPYALHDRDTYTRVVRDSFAALGIEVVSVHESGDPAAALREARAVFVGGGNTFRLLRALQQHGLLEILRERVGAGELRYMGVSAGINVTAPTIRTTNDMPIVQPDGLDSLGLVPFQLNAHYVDADANSTHMGETRAQRIKEFLEENEVPVLGLREGAWLRRRGDALKLGGVAGAVLFRRGLVPAAYAPDADLRFLLDARARYEHPLGT
jgi:dipeptidase E